MPYALQKMPVRVDANSFGLPGLPCFDCDVLSELKDISEDMDLMASEMTDICMSRMSPCDDIWNNLDDFLLTPPHSPPIKLDLVSDLLDLNLKRQSRFKWQHAQCRCSSRLYVVWPVCRRHGQRLSQPYPEQLCNSADPYVRPQQTGHTFQCIVDLAIQHSFDFQRPPIDYERNFFHRRQFFNGRRRLHR